MEKAFFNINELQKRIPIKPQIYTSDIPYSIKESLQKYLRTSTNRNILTASWIYDSYGWPLPFYIDPENIQIGLLHEVVLGKSGGIYGNFKYYDVFGKLVFNNFQSHEIKYRILCKTFKLFHPLKPIKYYDWFLVPIFCKSFKITNLSDITIDLFETNFKYYQSKVFTNQNLLSKHIILKDIFSTYNSKNYAACITSLYPLIDFLTREFLNIEDLSKSINYINKLLKNSGFSLDEIDNLKPGAFTEKYLHKNKVGKDQIEEFNKLSEKHEYNLGLPGIALSSFLHFSTKYYSHYKNDNIEPNILNRHAIMHGAATDCFTKENATKLLTYLYLMLELEPVLKIVFAPKADI